MFYKRLPAFYQPAQWDQIPKALDVAENIFRFPVFLLPLFFRITLESDVNKAGLVLYAVGVLVYFLSWAVQLWRQDKGSSRTALFRMAPAYTTVIWLSGIALLGKPYFNTVVNPNIVYVIGVILFVVIHTLHAYCVFRKQSPILPKNSSDNHL